MNWKLCLKIFLTVTFPIWIIPVFFFWAGWVILSEVHWFDK